MTQNLNAHPIVAPSKTFDPIELEDATLPSTPRPVIHEPLKRFILDRFKTMTGRQAAQFLAAIDMHILDQPRDSSQPLPYQFALMVQKLGLSSAAEITHERASAFYENYSHSDQQVWLARLLKREDTKQILKERTYDFLQTQLPAIGYTLAHIFEGGYIGLLTARGARSNHARQIQRINETLGFGSQLDLIYYVNDDELSKRLGQTGKNSAEKKALVLMNFINGLKEDKDGRWVPMKLGRPFEEIIFIDDEDKNLKAVMESLVRDVCSTVLREAGMLHSIGSIEDGITQRARKITETFFATERLKPLEALNFWFRVVDDLLEEFTTRTGKLQDRKALIGELRAEKRWLPDKLKVYDGNDIPFDKVRTRLDDAFASGQPLELGSKKSIVFNDIDGTLIWVPAQFSVHRRSDPEATPLLSFKQVDFAEHPSTDYWLEKVSQEQGIALDELTFSFASFREPELIERDLLDSGFQGVATQRAELRDEHR